MSAGERSHTAGHDRRHKLIGPVSGPLVCPAVGQATGQATGHPDGYRLWPAGADIDPSLGTPPRSLSARDPRPSTPAALHRRSGLLRVGCKSGGRGPLGYG